MALITRITNVLSNLRHRVKPSNANVHEYTKVAKKQPYECSIMESFADPDIINLGAEYSQDFIEDANNEDEPAINIIA